MNRFLGPASLGVSLLALVIALVGSRSEPPPPAPPPSDSSESSFSEMEIDALERRVKTLEDNALSLSKRLMLVEQRAGTAATGSGGTVPPGLAAEVEQLKAEVRGMVAGEALQSEGGRAYLKDMVRTVQDEMRNEQREMRQQRQEEAQAQAQVQRAERLRQFISDARLNYNQEQEVTRRMQAEDAQRQTLVDAMRSGQKSPRDARQEIRQSREETDKAVKALLDEGQQAKYDEMRGQEFRRAEGGGPGRGGRGGEGGGRGGGNRP